MNIRTAALALSACGTMIFTLGGGLMIAHAQTGVSDDRVSLPEGPGSLEGIGDDVSINANMGAMSWSVPIALPGGYAGMTPDVALSYSSSAGNGIVGMGWSFDHPSIERLTLRGVPEYLADDEFVAGGGEQLVHTETLASGEQVYRARFEGSFVRYTWHDVGGGDAGYWRAELPDGRTQYFGARADGTLVSSSRVDGPDGTFRYNLVETVDPYGHRIEYTWFIDGTTSLLAEIGYVFEGTTTPRYRVSFTYEDRIEWMSNATAGFEEITTKRLADIAVAVAGTTIRNYSLTYESAALSGGLSRLSNVTRYGVDGSAYPIDYDFGYASTLGQLCDGNGCERPFIETIEYSGGGALNLGTGTSTLIDLNGDGLPDLLETSAGAAAAHKIYYNELASDGSQSFSAAVDSAFGFQDGHDLSNATVQVLDVNGDGFTDLSDALTGQVLINTGQGDWDGNVNLFADAGLAADMTGDFSAGELQTLRFMDYDNDRMIDVIKSSGSDTSNITTIYRNTGAGGFVADPSIDALGAGFDSDTLELNDFNGDGLLDAVQVQATQVRYRLNLGWGHWADWRTVPINANLSNQEAIDAELEDVNGDALTDLVLVSGDTVRLWINQNAQTFAAERTITSADVDGSIPVRSATTTVLFADMNGNGSSDITWFDPGQDPVYLDLYPVPANLLTRIDNGIGMMVDIDYASSVEHMARDAEAGNPWTYSLPFPNIVVDSTVESDAHTGVSTTTQFSYHNGFYDGAEKAFRGYSDTSMSAEGDANHESGAVVQTWDVGATDSYFNGRELTTEVLSDNRSIQLETKVWTDCPVAEVPATGLLFDVRHICLTEMTTEVREGLIAADWLTLRTESTYDGYGNLTLSTDLGVVGVDGDERYIETEFVTPANNVDGRWILNLPFRTRVYGVAGSSEYSETLEYYDGEDFVGLPLGEASIGFVSRETDRVDTSGAVLDSVRQRRDGHGNVIEELDAEGAPGSDGNRRLIEYDDSGLRVTSVDLLTSDDTGAYSLRSELRYDDLFDLPTYATRWRVMESGAAVSEVGVETRAYDAHGRLVSKTNPGDASALPSETYTYEIGAPVTRIVTNWRSVSGGDQDLEIVNCIDGRGRVFQTRTRVDAGEYQVSDYKLFGVQGRELESFQPYTSASSACDTAPPTDTRSSRRRYDAIGRLVELQIDSDENGGFASQRYEYRPLETWVYDFDDETAGDPHEDTPTVTIADGLGQTIAVGRTLTRGAQAELYAFEYSETGDLIRTVDPLGNERIQDFDLVGRVTRVVDPDRGATTYVYDQNGLVTSMTDATGATVRTEYDGLGRVLEQWVDGDRDNTLIEIVYDRSADCPTGLCTYAASRRIATHYASPNAGEQWSDWLGYDAAGRLETFHRDLGLGTPLEVVSRYDNVGRLQEVTYPGGRSVQYNMDGANRASSIPSYIRDLQFNGRGDLLSVTYDNDVVATQTLDTRRRQIAQDVLSPTGEVLVGFDLSYDAMGRITGVVDRAADGTLPSHGATYSYDAFGRITQAALDQGSAGIETLDFGYDAADNLVSRTSSVGAASPVHDGVREFDGASPRRLTTLGDLQLGYDEAGSLTTRGDAELTWDGHGRLREVRHSGMITSMNVYAADQNRVQSYSDSQSSYFVDPDFVIEDGVASFTVELGGVAIARHTYNDLATDVLSDINLDGAIDAGDGWLALAMESGFVVDDGAEKSPTDWLLSSSARQAMVDNGDEIVWLHRDSSQHLVAVTDASGAVIERSYRYPFGAPRSSTTTMPERRSFSNQSSAELTPDFVAFGSRYYDPIAARWISPDLLFAQITVDDLTAPWEAMGNYLYVSNSPLSAHDPTGAVGELLKPHQAAYISGLFADIQSPSFSPVGDYSPTEVLDTLYRSGLATDDDVDFGIMNVKTFVSQTVAEHGDLIMESLRMAVLSATKDVDIVEAVTKLNEFTSTLVATGGLASSDALVADGDMVSAKEYGNLSKHKLKDRTKAAKKIRKRVKKAAKKRWKAEQKRLKAEKKRLKKLEGSKKKQKVKVTAS